MFESDQPRVVDLARLVFITKRVGGQMERATALTTVGTIDGFHGGTGIHVANRGREVGELGDQRIAQRGNAADQADGEQCGEQHELSGQNCAVVFVPELFHCEHRYFVRDKDLPKVRWDSIGY